MEKKINTAISSNISYYVQSGCPTDYKPRIFNHIFDFSMKDIELTTKNFEIKKKVCDVLEKYFIETINKNIIL